MVRDKFPSAANGPELEGLPHPAYDGVIDPAAVRELPLAIQDRAFTNDSQLWFPVSGIPASEALPSGAAPPRWVPELVATVDALGVDANMLMMAVNGRTWPRHTVYPDAYRLRILNACQTRTLQLRLARCALRLERRLRVAHA
jgi:bilirubin oxidase